MRILCQTLDVRCWWLKAGILPVVVGLSYSPTSSGALGGATQPPGPHSRLEEVSPLIENIEIIKGDPYIEVFIVGTGHLDCYDVREFQVEKLPTATQIIPRLRRSNPDKPCKLGLQKFRDKAADLDPNNPSSSEIQVLGFRGWHKRGLNP